MKGILLAVFLTILLQSAVVYGMVYPVGSRSLTYYDPARNNRAIPVQVYYPGVQAGTNVQVAEGKFPVVVFGHGFAMVYSAYQYLWNDLVPGGYIVILPTTEGSIFPAPNHQQFGLDLAFCLSKMKSEGEVSSSPFYGRIASTSAIMGHSMGGGAAFLACQNNSSPTTLVTFAAANTNPSAITAAQYVTIPSVVFAGANDCVTPPSEHQIPMYNALATSQKMMITIQGGGHCYFADYNFNCAFGEATCSPSPAITRTEQQSVILDYLNLYFNYILKGRCNSWGTLNDSLNNSSRITFQKSWTALHQPHELNLKPGWNNISTYINPLNDDLGTLFDPEYLQGFIGIQNLAGSYYPSGGINTLAEWNSESGYFLKVSQPDVYSFCGTPLTNAPLELEAGWNLIPVTVNCMVDTDYVVQVLGNKLQLIIEPDNGLVCWPSQNISTLQNLIPGKSYLIKVSQNSSLTFPECEGNP